MVSDSYVAEVSADAGVNVRISRIITPPASERGFSILLIGFSLPPYTIGHCAGEGGESGDLYVLPTSHKGLVIYSHAVQMSRLPFYLKIT